jgi:hypothetical protein
MIFGFIIFDSVYFFFFFVFVVFGFRCKLAFGAFGAFLAKKQGRALGGRGRRGRNVFGFSLGLDVFATS